MLNKDIHRLFCEGSDDLHVISALLNQRIAPEPFPHDQGQTHIVQTAKSKPGDRGNADAALREFASALENQRLKRIGLVVDRDTPGHRRVETIRTRLSEIDSLWNEPIREKRTIAGLGETGVIVDTPDGRRWGIWLMPDNRSEGALENFIQTLPLTHRDLGIHAAEATEKARCLDGAFLETQKSKARLHAYLAWTRHPGRPYGDAIRYGHVGAESSAANAFVEWFTELFIQE